LKLCNAIFLSGIYPSKWSESYMTSIFKSEDPQKPENYRGIAINNSIGKLFNLILYNRLDKFLSDHNNIDKTQIGFSKKARTSDHISQSGVLDNMPGRSFIKILNNVGSVHPP
jgi:hypothetical protein